MNINKVFKNLEISIIYLQTFIYILIFILITRSIFYMIYNYFQYTNVNKWYRLTKMNFNYTISLSLSAILFIEILKLFYIKTMHQIFIVSGIVVLKLLINYFVGIEIENQKH